MKKEFLTVRCLTLTFMYIHVLKLYLTQEFIFIYMNYKLNKLKIDPNVWPVLVDKTYNDNDNFFLRTREESHLNHSS